MEHLDSSHEDNFAVDSIESSNSDIKSILQDETTNKIGEKRVLEDNSMLIPKKIKLSVKLEFLKERIEQLVSDINMKRKRDSEMLEEFRKNLEQQTNIAVSRMEGSVYGVYNNTNRTIEEKLQEFMMVMARIEKQEAELEEFKRVLELLYRSSVMAPEV